MFPPNPIQQQHTNNFTPVSLRIASTKNHKMLSSWRRCRHHRRNHRTNTTTFTTTTTTISDESTTSELTIPNHFLCPISLDLMKDPVTLQTGITYDRENIETWIMDHTHTTCPVTNQTLNTIEPIPNHSIRRMIQDWCVENRNHGVERISTPRAPLTSSEASDLLARVSTSSSANMTGLVIKVKERVRESDRNRRLITSRGGARILAASFESLAAAADEKNVAVSSEILSCLVLMGRLDEQAQFHLRCPVSIKRIVWLMGKADDLSTRRNAVLILKQITTTENSNKSVVVDNNGVEALVKLVKEPICPVSLKASLVVLHRILSYSDSTTTSFTINKLVDLNVVTELLEIVIGTDKSLCEKALGVLDKLCDGKKGRVSLRSNALGVPVVVKKMLRVSSLATEFAVSVLWKLAVTEKEDGSGVEEGGGVLDEAIQVGAFQKLLLVLQVGLGGGGGESDEEGVTTTKVKVTQLLKMLNGVRRVRSGKSRFDCVESWDLKGVKKSF